MGKGLRSREHQAFLAVMVGMRKAKCWSQADLAEAVAWDPSIISKIESGERTCSVWEFMHLCRALGERPSKVMRRIESW